MLMRSIWAAALLVQQLVIQNKNESVVINDTFYNTLQGEVNSSQAYEGVGLTFWFDLRMPSSVMQK
jgi:hypothetical protein